MAQVIKSSGEVIETQPANGTDFSLEELQAIVGGYICLAKPRPEEEDGDNVMGDIKEKIEEFIGYLDSVIGD